MLLLAVLVLDDDVIAVELDDGAVVLGEEHVGRVARRLRLDAGADVRRLGLDQGHGLALHVGAHERAVGVVVLEERDERGGHRHDLLRRHVHQLDLFGRHRRDLGGRGEVDVALELELQVGQRARLRRTPGEHAVFDERAVGVQRRVGLGDDVLLLLVGGEVDDLALGDLAVLDDQPVRRLDEAELVDAGVRGQRADEADVGAFRRLDRAHAAVVREVHVADFEAGPLAGQTTRAERAEAAAMGEARQRVDLVHELRQLAGAEELLDGGNHRTDVDQRLRRDGLDVLRGHALFDDALHTRETDAHLVLDQLTDRANAAVGEVILVVEAVARRAIREMQQVTGRREDLAPAEHRLVRVGGVDLIGTEVEHLGELRDLGAELAVELVAADPGEVIAPALEEGVAEVRTRRLDRRRLARASALVDLDERFVLGRREVAVLLPLPLEEVEVTHEALEEPGRVLLVVAEGAQQHEQAEATLAGDAGAGGDVLARLLLDVELDPLTAVRVDRAGDELVLREVAETEALTWLEDDARATDELRHDDALGAVDHERALVGHHGEVTHEDGLLLDLAGGGVHEAGAHEDRRGEGHVLLLALLHRELRRRAQVFVRRVELQLELERLGEVLDRADVAEGLRQPLVQEPVERFPLDRDQIREGQRLVEIRERVPLPHSCARRQRALLPVDFRPDTVAARARSSHGTTFRTEDAERHGNR